MCALATIGFIRPLRPSFIKPRLVLLIFILHASSYAPDTLRRKGRRETENLLIAGRRLKERIDVITILSPLVQKSCLAQMLHSFPSDAVSVPKLTPRVQKVVELLLDIKDMEMMSYVNPSRLSPLSDVDDQTRKIWCETTTGLPITVSSATCWRTRCPSFVEIWTEASKIKAKSSNSQTLYLHTTDNGTDLRVYDHGGQGGVASRAFCQLAKPDRQNPTYIVGMELPALTRDTPFRSNSQLHEKLTPHLEDHMVFNCTPAGSFVDLHVGQ